MRNPDPDPFPYGGRAGLEFARTGPHLLVVGPTGSGKTRRVLGPGAILWDGPAVIVSSKPDLLALTATARSGRGPIYVLDLTGAARCPAGAVPVRADPVLAVSNGDDALTLAELLLRIGSLGAGTGGGESQSFWQSLASGPLAALIEAAGPGGMPWVMSALGRIDGGDGEPGEVQPSWAEAVERCGDYSANGERLAALAMADDRLRDSTTATMTVAQSAWQRQSVRAAGVRPWDPSMLVRSDCDPTLFLIAPASGVAAGAAVAIVDQVIQHWRHLPETERRPLASHYRRAMQHVSATRPACLRD